MIILGIDPGQTHSAWVRYDLMGKRIIDAAYADNGDIVTNMARGPIQCDLLAVEKGCPYAAGMPYGQTMFWTGRFVQEIARDGTEIIQMQRHAILKALAGSVPKDVSQDSLCKQVLWDLFGDGTGTRQAAVGTRTKPGPLYPLVKCPGHTGKTQHLYDALAVAVAAARIVEQAGKTGTRNFNY